MGASGEQAVKGPAVQLARRGRGGKGRKGRRRNARRRLRGDGITGLGVGGCRRRELRERGMQRKELTLRVCPIPASTPNPRHIHPFNDVWQTS